MPSVPPEDPLVGAVAGWDGPRLVAEWKTNYLRHTGNYLAIVSLGQVDPLRGEHTFKVANRRQKPTFKLLTDIFLARRAGSLEFVYRLITISIVNLFTAWLLTES